MILRLSIGKIKPGTWPEYQRVYKANLRKIKQRGVKGLLQSWLAEDVSDPNSGIAVSLWNNEANMRAYDESDFRRTDILAPLQPYFLNEFTTRSYEVRVREDYRARRAPRAAASRGSHRASSRVRKPVARRAASRATRRPASGRARG